MDFGARHIGPDHADRSVMLTSLGYSDLETFIKAVVPAGIADTGPMGVPSAVGESQALDELQSRMSAMELPTSMIGLGYHGTVIPEAIKRGILLNTGWYTAYTPYQPEISQGRLEALLNFQTLVEDLTGLAVAGASLLDEATAVAEAVAIAVKHGPRGVRRVAIDVGLHPQVRAVVHTRAEPVEIEIVEFDPDQWSGRRRTVRRRTGVSGFYRADSRPARSAVVSEGSGSTRRHGRGSVGSDAPALTRGARCRYSRRIDAAIRRSDGLRRSARRIYRGPVGS